MEPRKKLSDLVNMASLKAAWANTPPAPDRSPLPAGKYVCELIAGEAGKASTDNVYYKVTLRVLDGPFAGRRVWHDFYFTDKPRPYTMRALEVIGGRDL